MDEQTGLTTTTDEIALLADAVPALIAYLDSDLRYRFVNRTYDEWFGISREGLIGRNVDELMSTEGFELVRAGLLEARSGTHVSFEATLPYPTGKRTVR